MTGSSAHVQGRSSDTAPPSTSPTATALATPLGQRHAGAEGRKPPVSASFGAAVDDLRRRLWAGRFIGALWLLAAMITPLLLDNATRRTGWMVLATIAFFAIGLTLMSMRLDKLPYWSLDVMLACTTTVVAVSALLLPAQREALSFASVGVVPVAVALLPKVRAWLQAGYLLTLSALVSIDTVLVATNSWQQATAVGKWILLVIVVGATALIVRQAKQFLNRRTAIAEAVAQLGTRALGVEEPDALLVEALQVAIEVVGCDYGTAIRVLPDGQIRIAAEYGPQPMTAGTVVALDKNKSYVRYVLESKQAFVSSDLRSDARVAPPRALLARGVVSGVSVPVWSSTRPLGLLSLHDHRRHRFGRHEVATLTALGNVVAIAWERAEHREVQQRLAVYEDRERIALDLHDFAIQRIFAAGLSLQALRRHVPQGAPMQRLEGVQRDLDAAITDIRATIFSLKNGPSPDGLATRIRAAISKAARSMPFTPKVMLRGDMEHEVNEAVANDVLAVIGEALSNVARHARATSATVKVTLTAEQLRVVISDNGQGMAPDTSRRSGLDNLRLRAVRQGGTLHVRSVPGAGTSVVWAAPLKSIIVLPEWLGAVPAHLQQG